MELTNKREQYTVTHADTNLSLVGEVMVVEGTVISSFNGTLTKLSDSSNAGNFNYRESGDTCDQNLYSCPKDLTDEISILLDATVTAIKTQLGA